MNNNATRRCGWPELWERPVTFVGGLRVVFSILGGASASHMMGQQMMGEGTRAGSVSEDESACTPRAVAGGGASDTAMLHHDQVAELSVRVNFFVTSIQIGLCLLSLRLSVFVFACASTCSSISVFGCFLYLCLWLQGRLA